MKKSTFSLSTLILLAGTTMFSCGGKKQDKVNELSIDSVVVKETSHLFNDAAKPKCDLDVHYTYIKGAQTKALQDSINNTLIRFCLGKEYVGKETKKAIAEFKLAYIKDYKKDVEEFYIEDTKNNPDTEVTGEWYNYSKTIKTNIQYNEHSILVYQIDTYEYTGGAHGMYSSNFINFDLTTGKQLHLADIFKADYKKELTRLLVAQLEKNNKVTSESELEDIGYFITEPLAPTENFHIDKEGISFFYNVYEIAPYAMGTTVLKLTYPALQSLLKEGNVLQKLY